MFFVNPRYTEQELAYIINQCCNYLQAIKQSSQTHSADDRDKALQCVQNTLPIIRRYLTYIRTKELTNAGPKIR